METAGYGNSGPANGTHRDLTLPTFQLEIMGKKKKQNWSHFTLLQWTSWNRAVLFSRRIDSTLVNSGWPSLCG